MITIDGKQFRNLEEQVAYLTELHNIEKGLSEWGIRIVGTVTSASDLPDPSTYGGKYGDAYAVGTAAPYDFYIWTRVSTVEGSGYWFDYGTISIVGPQGPQGPTGAQGPQGIRGSQWFSGTGQPTTVSGYNAGDYYINIATGNIWHLHDESGILTWKLEGNIKGPQGLQGETGPRGKDGERGVEGPQGPAGPAGPIVDIVGEVDNVDQILNIDPYSVPRQTAYLQNVMGTKHVWIIIGPDDNLRWYDAGLFAAGTIVTVSGAPVGEFNADLKLSVPTSAESYERVPYVQRNTSGANTIQYWRPINTAGLAESVPLRMPNGSLRSAYLPNNSDYLDDTLITYKKHREDLSNVATKIGGQWFGSSDTITIRDNDYGMYIIKGSDIQVKFTIAATEVVKTGDLHMFWVSNVNNTPTILYIGFTGSITNPITTNNGELSTDILINANAQHGGFIQRIPMTI